MTFIDYAQQWCGRQVQVTQNKVLRHERGVSLSGSDEFNGAVAGAHVIGAVLLLVSPGLSSMTTREVHPFAMWTREPPPPYHARIGWALPEEISEYAPRPVIDHRSYPHVCKSCGAPALIMFSTIDCSKGCK